MFESYISLNHTVATVSSKFSILNCAFAGAKSVNHFTTHAVSKSMVKHAAARPRNMETVGALKIGLHEVVGLAENFQLLFIHATNQPPNQPTNYLTK